MILLSRYANRATLECIFNFFDLNGDGVISKEEFRQGCSVLNEKLPKESAIQDPDGLLALMDIDGNDGIDINEFFEVFVCVFVCARFLVVQQMGGLR